MHFGEVPNDLEEFQEKLAEAMLIEKMMRYRIRDGFMMAVAQMFKK